MSNLRLRPGGGRGIGLPPPSNFRSGHLSGVIPVSKTLPGDDLDDSRSASENDMTTDSEEEVYGGRYSLDSSPQDDRVPKNNTAAQRYYSSAQRQQPIYASGSVYSDDVTSSRETIGRGNGNVAERLMRGANRYPIGSNGYTEDESSDSAASSEFSSTQVECNNGAGPRARAYTDGYASSVPSRINAESAAVKDSLATDEEIPSAPPFCGSAGEIKPQVEPRDNIGQKKSDQSVRSATGIEGAAPSGLVPARLPTFHASAQGPWHSVIAYDACVRLCLHAWAKQCMEAPMFLENECALLRNAFSLQQVLLQSEEELMAKRSSELAGEGTAPKPKKMVGKMKVQVRKVKMALDPPKGCTFSSLRAPKIKMDAVRYRFYSLQSTLSTGWQALRKIRFVPRVPPNGSISRQSLAYVQASAQYVKQVSGLLKIGVTTLRSGSSSREVVQETYSCFLRLKSSGEEDAIRMQPGSGETHVFLPDSLGDDLIVEVQDSQGKQFGHVLAQVASITEDPGDKLRWWSIYREPEHELVGKLQLFINYSTVLDENSNLKIEMIYKIIAHMAANDRALIAEGSCGSPRSIKVFLGECNLDEMYA